MRSGGLSPFLAVSAFLFTASAMIGYYVGLVSPEVRAMLFEMLKEGLEPWAEHNALELVGLILLNNASKCLGAVLLGFFFGLAPLILGVANGFILGIASLVVAEERGALFMFVALTPHGVFEVPALLFSVAIGLKEGWLFIKKLGGGVVSLKEGFREGLIVYFKLVFPLLIIAALIEVSLTPLVVQVIAG